jgi:CysZ protein
MSVGPDRGRGRIHRAAEWEAQEPAGVGEGLEAFVGGVGFVLTTPSVWAYALVPAVILLVLACGLGLLGVWASWRTATAVIGPGAGVWGQVGGWLLTAGLALVGLLAALLLALCLAQPLSGFALEAIVRAQERALTGRVTPKPGALTSMLLTTRATLLALLAGGPVLALLFGINLVFPVAVIVTVPLKLLVCGWMLAWDFFDYPLGLRGLGIRARLRWVGRRFGAFSAFGLAWALLVVVPGLVLLLLPMGVAGATRLVVREEANEVRGRG